MQQGKIVLLKVITNIVEYARAKKFGTFCFYCEKYFSGKGTEHRCKYRRSCFSCHRPLLHPTTYINKTNISYFCASEMEPREKNICHKCNVTIYNESCKKIHARKNCRWGWFCLSCNQYTFRSKYLKTVEIIKQTHICATCFCLFCGNRIQNDQKEHHLCPIFKLKPPHSFTKLAFLQLNFTGSNAAWCINCTVDQFCSFCIDNNSQEKPNIGVLLVEGTMGHFDSYTFADTNLLDYVSYQKNLLIQEYIPNIAKNQKQGEPKTGNFGTTKKVRVKKSLFLEEVGVMSQILNFMLQKGFSDKTVLVNCSESNELTFFAAELIRKGLVPKVLKQNGRILLLECPDIGLRMVDTKNYLSTSFTELSSRSTEQFVYFPRKWNKTSLYSYVGKIPRFKDFCYFDDTSAEIQLKKEYVSAFQGQWVLKDELVKNTQQKVLLNAQNVLTFISHAFEMQKILFTYFSKHDQRQGEYFFHPFNRPLLTFSGFAYQLFLSLCNADIRVVKGPIEYNSSKGEVEFASFLAYISKKNLEYAWSSHGQNKSFLPISVPDAYDKEKKTLYYFNGCYVHGHQHSKECKFKRNLNIQSHQSALFKEKHDSFYKKMKKLASHPDVQKIKIIWQCSWVEEKRKNDIVKQFMRNIYKNPPTYRLDSRCSGTNVNQDSSEDQIVVFFSAWWHQ